MLSSMYTIALKRKFIHAITIYRSILLWPWILSVIRLLSLRKTCRCSSFTLRTLFLHFNVSSRNYRYISLTYWRYTFVTTHARSISRAFIEMMAIWGNADWTKYFVRETYRCEKWISVENAFSFHENIVLPRLWLVTPYVIVIEQTKRITKMHR